MKLFVSVFLFLVLCYQAAAQTSAAAPESDKQLWNETQLVVWSNKKNEFALNGVLRIGRDFSFPVDNRIGFSYSHKPSKYLTLTGGYLYRAAFPTRTRKTFENRFIGTATVNLPLVNKFKLIDRNQFEYRAVNSRPDVKVYRNRLRIERDVKINGTKITPFVFTEVFYNPDTAWYRARYAAGISRKFSEKFTGEIFYLRQADGIARPGDLNVIGMFLKIHL